MRDQRAHLVRTTTRQALSMALMLVLETLSPTERAVFVPREACDVGYDEIAAAVGRSPAAVRQIALRARGRRPS